MKLPRSSCCVFALFLTALLAPMNPLPANPPPDGTPIQMEVDARDLPRLLLHTRLTIPCQPGKLKLWFPKWIPGVHAPAGPIGDIGGLRIETPDGKVVPWERDEVALHSITCKVPDGVKEVRVKLDTIASRSGGGCSGNSLVGLINWNHCLFYPEGMPCSDIPVQLKLQLPAKWSYATALKTAEKNENQISFHTVALDELIDSPLIAGEHLRSIKLEVGQNTPAYFHVASESPSALQLDSKVIDKYAAVVREAGALFGAAHYPEYHFLVTCSDELGYFGLEHHASSINGVKRRDLIDNGLRKDWIANLIPHEYAHSWCGKFRRPASMFTPDYHSPQKTKLLWVYEGLTMYTGDLLMVRSGLIDPQEYKEMLAERIGNQKHREGRRWRPLEDTAVANPAGGGRGSGWTDLRRESNDYYYEGMLLWLEVDAMLREMTKGEKSIDDFCQKFMGPIPTKDRVVTYEFQDVVKTLKSIADYDWDGFLRRRVSAPQEALPLEVVDRCGYRLEYGNKPSAFVDYLQRGRGFGGGSIIVRDSLGLTFTPDGKIANVFPGMIGDRAKLAPGMQVIGVNGKKFAADRLYEAIEDSAHMKKVDLLLLEGDRFRTVSLDYAGGAKFIQLTRDPGRPDYLAAILAPHAEKK
ncbi:MAG: M61 family metallopeptidase [Planctomycetes bacterium]|nr:M61 family metallopeptidase [Planctomycetota bacterium]